MNKDMKNGTDLFQERLYKQLLWILVITSSVNIISNLVIGYPFIANIKWICLIVLSGGLIKYGKSRVFHQNGMFVMLLMLICVVFPVGWYNSGAGHTSVMAYLFLLVITSATYFVGWKRIILLVLSMGIYLGFKMIEFMMPEFLPNYGEHIHVLDQAVQMPIVLLVSAAILIQFSDLLHEKRWELETVNSRLNYLAYNDHLTGLGNRAYIFGKLNELVSRKSMFVTMMIDLDNFKYVNDTFGHIEGDRLLKKLADLLKSSFGDGALIARYGGDEFIIIISDADQKEVSFLVKEFLKGVRDKIKIGAYGATLSGGYAFYDQDLDLDAYLRKVDMILYRAKGSGKDRILGESDTGLNTESHSDRNR